MHPIRLAALALLLAGPAAATTPIAEIICAPRDEMTTRLTRQFGVTRAGSGVRDIEQVMELWTSERNGDWTLVVTYSTGKSCIVATGEYWENDAPGPAEDPA